MKTFFITILAFFTLQITVSFAQCTISQLTSTNTINYLELGESWIAPCSGNLSSIIVNTDNNQCTGSLTLKIFNYESNAPGNLIYSQPINLSQSPSDQTITLTGNCPVISGNQYTFIISSTVNYGVYLKNNNTAPYLVGNIFVNDGSSAGFYNLDDLYFQLNFSQNHIPTLPEWGLILLGAVFAGFGGWFVWKKE